MTREVFFLRSSIFFFIPTILRRKNFHFYNYDDQKNDKTHVDIPELSKDEADFTENSDPPGL